MTLFNRLSMLGGGAGSDPWAAANGGGKPGGQNWLQRNSDVLLSAGLGALSGRNAQEQSAGLAQGLVNGLRQNRTAKYLQENDPELAQAVQNGMLDIGDAFKLSYTRKLEAEKAKRPDRSWVTLPDGQYGWADQTSGSFTPLGKAAKTENNPALVQEYQFAKNDGFQGGFSDYVKMKATSSSSTSGSGGKAPSGYRWTDPSESSLEPIPGGPGEEMPGELAGKIGMAKSFIARVPELRKKVANGDVTGWWDQTAATNGFGERGQIYQELQSGTDALIRLMTGAGMNETEAKAYAERYLPTRKDSAESATAKLDRLTQELTATAEEASRGRGGFKPSQGPAGNEVDDLVRQYGG